MLRSYASIVAGSTVSPTVKDSSVQKNVSQLGAELARHPEESAAISEIPAANASSAAGGGEVPKNVVELSSDLQKLTILSAEATSDNTQLLLLLAAQHDTARSLAASISVASQIIRDTRQDLQSCLQKIDTLERKNKVFKEDIRKFQDKVSILQDASDQKHSVEDSVAVAKLGQLEVPDSSLVLSQRRLLYWRAKEMLPILEALESCMSDDLKTKFRSLRNALV
jgi:hypothetical protein